MTAPSQLCDPGQLTKPLSAPASSSVKWRAGQFHFWMVASEGTESDRSTVRQAVVGAQAMSQVSLSPTPGASSPAGTGRHTSRSPAASPSLEPAVKPHPLPSTGSPGFLNSSRCHCATRQRCHGVAPAASREPCDHVLCAPFSRLGLSWLGAWEPDGPEFKSVLRRFLPMHRGPEASPSGLEVSTERTGGKRTARCAHQPPGLEARNGNDACACSAL